MTFREAMGSPPPPPPRKKFITYEGHVAALMEQGFTRKQAEAAIASLRRAAALPRPGGETRLDPRGAVFNLDSTWLPGHESRVGYLTDKAANGNAPRSHTQGGRSVETRIGKAERDAAVEKLNAHLDAERITYDEHDERVSRALNAHFNSDLERLFTDLPSLEPPARESRRSRRHRERRSRRWSNRTKWAALIVAVYVLFWLHPPTAILVVLYMCLLLWDEFSPSGSQ